MGFKINKLSSRILSPASSGSGETIAIKILFLLVFFGFAGWLDQLGYGTAAYLFIFAAVIITLSLFITICILVLGIIKKVTTKEEDNDGS